MTDDFYDLLDVPRDASQEEIRQAFRRRVRIYHPDLNDDDRARAQFTALKKAYDVLGDPVERRAYDRMGHEDYVAKRTSGLPSPDAWATSDEKAEVERSTVSTTAGDSVGGTADAFGNRDAASGDRDAGSGGHTHDSDSGGVTASSGRSARSNGSARSSASRASTGSAGSAGSNDSSSDRSGGLDRGSRRTNRTGPTPRPFVGSRFVRWWRSKNFALPLLLVGTALYLVGLLSFGLRNETGLRSLARDVSAVGVDPTGIWSAVAGGSGEVETGFAHVVAVDPVNPPSDPLLWYGVLGGLVAAAVLVLLAARLRWRRSMAGPITIDETIVLAAAVGTASGLLGGPLLAGSLLLPLLYGVVIYHTRQIPGWSPSYAYVVAVTGPAIALAAGWFGYESLPFETLAFVVLPLAGALGFPLRFAVRRRFGV